MNNPNLRQKLLYDKLAFTLPIDKSDRLGLIDKINDPAFHEKYKRQVLGFIGGRYNNNYIFTIAGQSIRLSVYPKNTNHNFLRVEYNPDKLGKDGRKAFRRFLIKLLGKDVMSTIYFNATVTRLDLTMDLFDIEPGVYIHKGMVKESEIYRDDFDDAIISQIVGSDRSDSRVTLYNKNIELGLEDQETNYYRLEVRLRNLDCTMDELTDDMVTELEKINFYCDSFLNDNRFSEQFLSDAYEEGLNAALYDLGDDNARRRYRRYLERFRIHPICFDQADIEHEKAHNTALRSLINKKYRDELFAGRDT